jgi:hypothetical protein
MFETQSRIPEWEFASDDLKELVRKVCQGDGRSFQDPGEDLGYQ